MTMNRDEARMTIESLNAVGSPVERPVRRWAHTRTAEAYCDENGRIIGEITDAIGGGYFAEVDGKLLGKYIDRTSAKRAIEQSA